MIKTRYYVNSVTELVEMMIDFDEALIAWSAENATATWDVTVYIGEYKYILETIIDNDASEKTTEEEDLD